MFYKSKLVAAALLAVAAHSASAIELKIDGYTASSLTFTLTGAMPATAPAGLFDGPKEIDFAYTGNLWAGGSTVAWNTLSASPIVGSGDMWDGRTGGYGLPVNYSWLYFENDLTGLQGSGLQVTLNFDNTNLLNTLGTGTIDLYWSNLQPGVDPSGARNVLLDSVSIVDGQVVQAAAVPEPATLALFGLGAAGLAALRRRKDRTA